MIRLDRAAAVASVALLLGACSHQVSLVNTRVPPGTAAAQIGPRGSRFFIDRIAAPVLEQQRIGRKKALSGRFLAWITTDSDMPAWAATEWRIFLSRHGQRSVPRLDQADYFVQCDIVKLSVDKKYDSVWNDDFSSHMELTAVIRQQPAGTRVFSSRIVADYFIERPHEDNDRVSDDDMFNRCLSMVMQKALEQIVFREIAEPKPVELFPVIRPL